jgi:hypothetical protein
VTVWGDLVGVWEKRLMMSKMVSGIWYSGLLKDYKTLLMVN